MWISKLSLNSRIRVIKKIRIIIIITIKIRGIIKIGTIKIIIRIIKIITIIIRNISTSWKKTKKKTCIEFSS